MIPLSVKIQNRPPSAAKIDKNLRFGIAKGLTKTAKEGQSAVLGALPGTFTLRGNWTKPSNKFGIRIRPAKPADLSAEVKTAADWLEIHEKGGTKKARSGRLAIPTENVRRNKRDIITRSNRPAALRGKKTFVLKTSRGDVLYQRRKTGIRYQGPLRSGGVTRRLKKTGSELVALYNFEPSVRIRKRSTFYEPIGKVVQRRGRRNIEEGMRSAIATMR